MILMTAEMEPKSLTEKLHRAMVRVKRLLFVDDDPVLVDFFTKFVRDEFSADIVAAKRTLEAVAFLENGQFDAAILDLKILNGSSLDLYRSMRERWPNTEVVFMTGYGTDEVRKQIEAIGPARVYSKDAVYRLCFLRQLMIALGFRPRVA
jgi:DNA-binding NarL/FixJ family response regulator